MRGVMRTISRVIMVVVFLLLPVFMTGASLEVPGADCCAHNCCLVAQCAGHAGADELPEGWSTHHHERHAHDRILLLRDASLRDPRTVAPLPLLAQVPVVPVQELEDALVVTELVAQGPPPYGGFLCPQRC